MVATKTIDSRQPTAGTPYPAMWAPIRWTRLAHMSLFCWICGSGSAWELWWVAAEGEHCEGDEGFRAVEPERDSGE